MRPLTLCLLLSACLQSTTETTIGVVGTCAGTLDALVGGQPVALEDPVAAGAKVQVRCVTGGRVTAWGASVAPAPVNLHDVGSFTKLRATLTTARGGHTATKLDDGRVVIIGGFSGAKPADRIALASIELYSPATGAFSPGGTLSLSTGTMLPKAFHSAVLLGNGQVMVHGGEGYIQGTVAPQSTSLIYDVSAGGIGAVPARLTPPNIPRTRHQALLAFDGTVLLVGGMRGMPLSPVDEVEFYDPLVAKLNVVAGLQLPRAGAAAVWRTAKNAAVVGGNDGTSDLATVTFLSTTGLAGSVTMSSPHPDAVSFIHGDSLVVASASGGEELDLQQGTSKPLSALTSAPGSCALATGPDVWVVLGNDTSRGVEWTSTGLQVDTFEAPPRAQRNHTCTLLDDGTVLVLGGVDTTAAALDEAYLFTPPLR